MRVRFKPWAREKLQAHPEIIVQNPDDLKDKWHETFNNQNPIHLEVGAGKGQFIINTAKQNPDINFVSIELNESVLVIALEKVLEEENITNLKFIASDGREVSSFFEQGEISQVYLNFSDPWPKKRHAKRRLTSPEFLTQYKSVIAQDGEIHFKTDNQVLFEYSLSSMSTYGMALDHVYLDLHNSEVEDNVMTEYEEKFSSKGQRIYKLIAHYKYNI